jgi:hypothetical protein
MLRIRLFQDRRRRGLHHYRSLYAGGRGSRPRKRTSRLGHNEFLHRQVPLERHYGACDPKIVNTLEFAGRGSVEVNGVEFEALRTMESLKHKESPDENAIYRFEVEGVSVLHLGDLGNPLTNEQLDRLHGKVDILLALTGGPPTIELEDLDRAIEEIGPRLVIPMHYQIPRLKLDILPLEAFTSRYPQGAITRVGSAEVKLSQSTLPQTLQIYGLKPAG